MFAISFSQKRTVWCLIGTLLTASLLHFGSGRLHLLSRQSERDQKVAVQTQKSLLLPRTMDSIEVEIARMEYHISFNKKQDCYQSPNRNNNFSTTYLPGKLTLTNRGHSNRKGFSFSLINAGLYADGKKIAVGASDAVTSVSENKLHFTSRILTEEFVNNEAGVRQNFIVHKVPSGTKNLLIKIRPEGMKVKDLNSNKLLFYDKDPSGLSGNTLAYNSLKCWGADGEILDASMTYHQGLIEISVNAENAHYPVTIDPLIANGNPANADMVLEGFQSGANFGTSVSSAGDLNADGYSDVIVGAPNYFENEVNQGAFFIFMGSPSGLQTNNSFPYTGVPVEDSFFGTNVCTAGDVNGDGYSDVMVSAPGISTAFLYYGSAAGLNATATSLSITQNAAGFASSISMAGDLNGDGFSDVMVGAKDYSKAPAAGGAVFFYFGSQTGIVNVASDTIRALDVNAAFGNSLASAGDVNGDGYSDVIIGSPNYHIQPNVNAGAAFIYHGKATGISNSPSTTLKGKHASSRFGHTVSSAGDFNADGYSDIIVGSNHYSNGEENEGAAFIYLSKNDGSGVDVLSEMKVEGGSPFVNYGESVACAGDVNGDGFSDIVIGERYGGKGGDNSQRGWVYVLNGNQKGELANYKFYSVDQSGAQLGTSVACAGDVNGDGLSDLVFGAPKYNSTGTDDGIALVFHGYANLISINVTTWHQGYKNNYSQYGRSLANAGDVNGDGYDDYLIGAPEFKLNFFAEGAAFLYYGNSTGVPTIKIITGGDGFVRLGRHVSGAGDVNADGFDDIIISADDYEVDPAKPYDGAALIYYGSSAGIDLTHCNKVYLDPSKGPTEGQVACGGDINGDGYDDVVVAAYDIDHSSILSSVIVSYGSPQGIQDGPGTILTANEHIAFGSSVAIAGDINGDGFDDVLVGALGYKSQLNEASEGACFVYYGSASGIETSPAYILDINVKGANLGTVVAGAGDVNGDGYDDFVAGAPWYTNGHSDEGAAVLYYGSATGIDKTKSLTIEGDQKGAHFGSSISSGDVNGDGYSDVAIGATDYHFALGGEGGIFVYLGTKDGINVASPQIFKGVSKFSQTGYSVCIADVNGDGYHDLLGGAPGYKESEDDNQELGIVFIHWANSKDNVGNYERLKNIIKPYNTDLTWKLTHQNLSEDQFGMSFYGKSFLGRNRSKLVWETLKPGQPYSKGSDLISNSTYQSGEGSFTNVQFANHEVKSLIEKDDTPLKYRARVKFDPVLAITGQVYGPWRYMHKRIRTNQAVFPVELISFDVISKERQVFATWQTASEENSDQFEIERSGDGKDWKKIGNVAAMQNSASPQSYLFTDDKPLTGKSYYRLKMVDLDGTFTYSLIRSVDIESLVTLYPNPAQNVLNINSEKPVTEVHVLNSKGEKLMSVHDNAGLKSIDISKLPTGLYLIQMNGESRHFVKE